ncbi:c2H2-type domain-containing protein [Caerostris darwini]|uniref:C2H2-type domain-containing protein n=1 Tax=Caerostris darwini TaxID=1538125 RepID=A0AAV4MHN2_9ARAC|nr:c2H2-type domain-containing protein [Caerostris darwini]
MANFQIWLEAESSSTFTFFRKLNGNLVRGNKIFHYYSCQFYNPYYQSRSTLCFRNKKEVIPVSLNCPVRINVCEEKGLVSATYYPIHNHHTGFHNTKYQRFKDSTRNLIKSYLLLSFPIVEIQNLIRGNVGFRRHRSFVPSKEAFISRRSIRTYYRRLQNSVRPEKDTLSVMCNVERLKAEEYNPILLFKPQNFKTLYGPPGLDALLNSDKSFALGIQTETQKEMLIKHSYKIICIDSTHDTNRYGFYLLSIHIQDEYGQGYPVAHFICNYLDYDTLVTLFNSLKCRISNLRVYKDMTDDDNVCYTAFNSVFGPNLNHLLFEELMLDSVLSSLNTLVAGIQGAVNVKTNPLRIDPHSGRRQLHVKEGLRLPGSEFSHPATLIKGNSNARHQRLLREYDLGSPKAIISIDWIRWIDGSDMADLTGNHLV